eukprot:CAMPEP_0116882614 /NCGR_PEP_ID=MMETSP0463-20121206/14903_1 /TAXON_ID=181622 /ORGANISM="Strombidinopsis sp, Strain SopsisLIS2011" /LENGTH=155 /DNA_ID=CAMNT_0004536089 /DNA_START=3002 /DNA_END=3469 /DNA_ORIENTATION=-
MTISPKRNSLLLDFFYEIGYYLLETYYVVLTTLDLLSTNNLRISFDKLVEQVHEALKELHSIQVIKNLHSCLDETLRVSLRHFGTMGLADIKTYANIDGQETVFISVPEELKDKINDKLEVLGQYLQLNNEGVIQIEDEVAKAVETASVIYLAKL